LFADAKPTFDATTANALIEAMTRVKENAPSSKHVNLTLLYHENYTIQ